MKNKNKIEKVAMVAKSKESKAAKNLSDRVEDHRQAKEQQSQILQYRDEYQKTLDRLSESGVDPRTLNEYRAFLANLDGAIAQQKYVVDQAEQKVGDSRSEWLSRYHRTTALNQLAQRQADEKRVQDDKKRQKEVDDNFGNAKRRAS